MLDPDDEATAEEIGALLARAHVVLARGRDRQAADEALRTAARRLQAARSGLSDYDARRAVVHALRTAYPEHGAFALAPEPTLSAPGVPEPPSGEAEQTAFFAAAAAWPAERAAAVFRSALQAGWNRAGAHLPDADWARRLHREFAGSPYGEPARPAWLA
jgi:hypothetical protein